MALFKSSRNSFKNALKTDRSWVFCGLAKIVLMRSICVLAIFATSFAQSSQ